MKGGSLKLVAVALGVAVLFAVVGCDVHPTNQEIIAGAVAVLSPFVTADIASFSANMATHGYSVPATTQGMADYLQALVDSAEAASHSSSATPNTMGAAAQKVKLPTPSPMLGVSPQIGWRPPESR